MPSKSNEGETSRKIRSADGLAIETSPVGILSDPGIEEIIHLLSKT